MTPDEANRLNRIPHFCHACHRKITRAKGLHASPLEPNGAIYAPVLDPGSAVLGVVYCPTCCPADRHDDDVWCSILRPLTGDP